MNLSEHLQNEYSELREELELYPFHKLLAVEGRTDKMKASAIRELIANYGERATTKGHGIHRLYCAAMSGDRLVKLWKGIDKERVILGSFDLLVNYMETLKEYEEYYRAIFALSHTNDNGLKNKKVKVIIK